MRLLSFLAGLTGLFMAATVAAQTTPAPAVPGLPAPPPAIEAENVWNLDLSTGGRVSIQLRPDVAPASVERIKTLTRQHFYDGLVFHRVIEGFMAQGGDPTGTGASGSSLPDVTAEIHGLPHVRGAVGMARGDDLNTANSQFYIMFVPKLNMDRQYTLFGRVFAGMSFVDTIERGEPPLNPTRIVRASIGADNVPQLSAEQLRAAAARPIQAQAQAPVIILPGAAAPAASAPVPPSAVPAPVPAATAVSPAPAAAAPPPAAPAPTPAATTAPAPVPGGSATAPATAEEAAAAAFAPTATASGAAMSAPAQPEQAPPAAAPPPAPAEQTETPPAPSPAAPPAQAPPAPVVDASSTPPAESAATAPPPPAPTEQPPAPEATEEEQPDEGSPPPTG